MYKPERIPNLRRESPSAMLRKAWGLTEEEMALIYRMIGENGAVLLTATVEDILRSLDNIALSRSAEANGKRVVDEDGVAVELPSRRGEQELVRELKQFIDDYRRSKAVS